MISRYRCSYCKGTIDRYDNQAAACPNGIGQMKLEGQGVTMPSPPTGCLKSKERFLQTAFEQRFFVPATARGKFDCTYHPGNGILRVTVRLNAEFGGFLDFSGGEKEDIKNALAASVPRYWDGKCTLRCVRHGWTDIVVRPEFAVEFGYFGSHFKLVITRESEKAKTSPSGRECRGFVSLEQVTNPSAYDRVELRDFQTSDFNHNVGGLLTAGNDREFLENALAQCGAALVERPPAAPRASLPFGGFSTETAALGNVLNAFAVAANRQLTGSHPIPVLLKGFANTTEPVQLATRRAEAIRAFLKDTARLKNPIVILPAGSGKAAVEISIDRAYEQSFITNQQQFQYNVAAHEFGHLIGLPDEYENPDAGSKKIVKDNYLALVHRAGQLAPTFPSHTSSMMSDGMTLMPWHFVTVWDALCYMTREFVDPNEWTIHVPA